MMSKRGRVIKADWARNEEITAFGGLALVERLAVSTRLWSDCGKLLPARCKREAGYSSLSVAASVIHGLLSGAQGTFAAQSLREDEPLKRLLGLEGGVPEEATVWRALGQWAGLGGEEALSSILHRQALRLIGRTALPWMLVEGFFPIFADGTNLEVESRSGFEGKKTWEGTSKLQWSVVWCGPYAAAQGFAAPGEDEKGTTMRLIAPVWRQVIEHAGLAKRTLFLMDSLYGDAACLLQLEACKGAHYIVGANKLAGVQRAAAEQPESQWKSCGANARRGWSESALCVHTYQAGSWEEGRVVVTRRFKREGEMIWNYASVFTNLSMDHPRIKKMMRREKIDFARALWRLYDRKQAMENQFKDALEDLGLHHPPCRRLSHNAMFYALGMLALNLAVGVRKIAMEAEGRRMRLWRLRREFFAIAARVVLHARQARAILYSTSARVRGVWSEAMQRLEAT